jgi:hypothetical protein
MQVHCEPEEAKTTEHEDEIWASETCFHHPIAFGYVDGRGIDKFDGSGC